MDAHNYWRTQSFDKPLYPDFEWNKPERRDQAGKLAIIGGNKLGFAAVAESYQLALTIGAGRVRTVLPDALKATIPPIIEDVVFAPSNPSGGFASQAVDEIKAAVSWSDVCLLVGDNGQNSQTAVLFEDLLSDYNAKLVVTRDAVDLLLNSAASLVERPDTILVLSFAQLQKLFRAVYYPKVLTFNIQLMQLVEALHKFTITYPVAIEVFHNDTLVIAKGGDVVTQAWDQPMAIWRGQTATRTACYWLWSDKTIPAVAASLVAKS